jgi:hypothetical protein
MVCRSIPYLQSKAMDLLDSLSLVLSMLKDASHGRLIDILPPTFILVVAPYRTFKGGHTVKFMRHEESFHY